MSVDAKLLRSFSFGVAGVILTYASEFIAANDFGVYTPVVAGLWTVISAQAWRFLRSQPPEDQSRSNASEVLSPEQLQQQEQQRSVVDETRFGNPFYSLALMLMLPGVACAQFDARPPRAIIQGPTHAIPGEMIVLDASQSDGAAIYHWTISEELRGRKQLIPLDDGKRCQVASYGGRYVVTLIVSNAAGIDVARWELNINGERPCDQPEPPPHPVPDDGESPAPRPGPVPVPEPKPEPTPIPEPILPPPQGEFSIAPTIFAIASTAASSSRIADCQRLASECDRIQGVQATLLMNRPTAMMAEILAVVTALPGGWEKLKDAIKPEVLRLNAAGKLKTADDIARLLREIKPAFELAAKVK